MAASHISQNASMILARYIGRIEKQIDQIEKENKHLQERGIIVEGIDNSVESLKQIMKDLFECAEENILRI